jgi:hypothetical protein
VLQQIAFNLEEWTTKVRVMKSEKRRGHWLTVMAQSNISSWWMASARSIGAG